MSFAAESDACTGTAGAVCQWTIDRTGSESLARVVGWLVDTPLRVLIVVILAFVAVRLARRAINRFGEALIARNGRTSVAASARADQRTRALMLTLGSLVTGLTWLVAALVILGLFDVNLAPLLAGAGVLGVVIGIGAQSVVADFLAGAFMLVEDQFGVGDVVDIGDAVGTVEDISLRLTSVRDIEGNLWHVPNSQIQRVANKSQLWSRSVLDISVAYDTDLRRAQDLIAKVADDLCQDPEFDRAGILEPPEVWGVEALGADGVTIRLVVKTDPAKQWIVSRELRLRIKEAFDRAGIEMPFPQRTVWVHRRGDGSRPVPDQTVAGSHPRGPTG
ncbi:MAG: mechanosensitive ion channel family protein [Acidimicrobiales bacterium]